MRTWIKALVLIGITTIVLFPAHVLNAETSTPVYVIKLATVAPAESYWSDLAEKAKMYLESRSRGRAKIVWYMNGVMGDEPEIIKKMEKKEIQGAVLTTSGLARIQPALQVLMLPFLFQNYQEVDHVLDAFHPDFKRLLADKGYTLIEFTEVGFNHLYSQEPVRSIKDFSRLKMWVWKGEDFAEVCLRDLGFTNLVPVPLYETKAFLEKGAINAFYSPYYTQGIMQWYRNAAYMSSFPLDHILGAVVFDQAYFQSLPADIQSVLQQSFDFILKPLREIIREEEEKARQAIIKRGIKETKASPELIRELKQRSDQICAKYADQKYPRDLMQKIVNSLKESRLR